MAGRGREGRWTVMGPATVQYVRQLSKMLGGSNEREVARLMEVMAEYRVAAREPLFSAGEAGDLVYIVVSGRLKVCAAADNGKEVIIALARAGDIVGETALVENGVRQLSAEALDDSTLIGLHCADFEALMLRRPALACALTKMLARRMLAQQLQLQRVVAKPVGGRLAALLQDELQRLGHDAELQLDLTHQELAQRIGTSRETVTALLSRFVGLGIIAHVGRRIRVHDRDRLAACARGELKVSPRLPLQTLTRSLPASLSA